MEVIMTGTHGDISGGECNEYDVIYHGTTAAEVIEEIKEYTQHDKRFGRIGEFGCPEASDTCTCWEISLNHKTYIGNWAGSKPEYNPEDLNKRVIYVHGSGGWYCGINFDILTEEKKLKYDEVKFEKF